MAKYPFDIQKCKGTLQIQDPFVTLVTKNLTYLGPEDLMRYKLIENITFSKNDKVTSDLNKNSIGFYSDLLYH